MRYAVDRSDPKISERRDMAGEYAIEAENLVKAFGDTTVLSGIDLRVAPGSVYALLGPNGAGKTTLVRMLATLSRPDAGQARVAGFDIVRERQQVRQRISLTGQYAALDEHQTAIENLRMVSRLAGLSSGQARQLASALVEQFDLVDSAHRLVSSYSGGMRRRLDLALSLVRQPAVLFLDEPTTGLDPRSRQSLWQLISELSRSGVAIFLTTQYLEEADRLADRVAVIDHGQIVAEGSATELKRRVAEQRIELTLANEVAFEIIAEHLGSRAIAMDAGQRTIALPTDGRAAQIRGLLDDLDPDSRLIESFALQSATLDDVFLALTGHAVVQPDREPVHV
jgi:ABC-2 type transport system ATP-binding protein